MPTPSSTAPSTGGKRSARSGSSEFADYIIEELQRERILTPLTVLSSTAKFEAWMLKCTGGDANIISVIEKGVKGGKIAIPGAASPGAAEAFGPVGTVTDYLCAYGPNVAQRIKGLFEPLFDPGKDRISDEILEINRTIQEKAGYTLHDAQLAVAEAIKRQLRRGKAGLIIAECGSGKSKIGAAAMAAASGPRCGQGGRGGKTFNIVLCPSHIKEKWVREIEESLPNTFVRTVSSIAELDRLHGAFSKGGKHCYAVISKEMARDGYMHIPAVGWSRRRKGFTCPDCAEVIQMAISKDGGGHVHGRAGGNRPRHAREGPNRGVLA